MQGARPFPPNFEEAMKNLQGLAGLSIAASIAALSCTTAQANTPPVADVERACGPSITKGRSPEEIAKITEETRKVAIMVSKSSNEKDFLAPNAIWWSLGLGYIDPKEFFAHPPVPMNRGKPTSFSNTVEGITVEGDHAAIEMSHRVVWPDFTYDQHYHNLIIVRNGKVCVFKMFLDSNMSKQLMPGLKGLKDVPK
jgi:ketosteroid isomerase-like protein